jgi:L-asparagine transporter-like permease
MLDRIEHYGIFAMVLTLSFLALILIGLILITNGLILAVFPILGLFVIIKAYIDVKKDEKMRQSWSEQREAENEN